MLNLLRFNLLFHERRMRGLIYYWDRINGRLNRRFLLLRCRKNLLRCYPNRQRAVRLREDRHEKPIKNCNEMKFILI